jgi:ACS family tartrate transporter-like MFS transporter
MTTLIAKISARLLPLLFLLYFVNFLDRVNVGYAALQMNGDLGFTPEVYGLGASIFFLGYFFFEIPSNWMSTRVGARKWLARITISWGIVASLMAFVSNPATFYVLRFVLGVAEAGFGREVVDVNGTRPRARRTALRAVALDWWAVARLAVDVLTRRNPVHRPRLRRVAIAARQHPNGPVALDGRARCAWR